MLINNVILAIMLVLGHGVTIIGFIFMFIDIKNKIKISSKEAIKIVGFILGGLFIVALAYYCGRESVSGVEPGKISNIIGGNATTVLIGGTGNEVNINSTDNEEKQKTNSTIENVTLNHTELNMVVGDKKALEARVIYSDNTDTTSNCVDWWSSNSSVADVDSNGNITAISVGTTNIIAQASKDNMAKSETCVVTVSDPPRKPTGYSIWLSARQATIGEVFKVYVSPYEDDITKIRLYTISPSGLLEDFILSDDGKYHIDTETGIWTIYASVENEEGVYKAQKPEDYVTIEILSIENKFSDIMKEYSEAF